MIQKKSKIDRNIKYLLFFIYKKFLVRIFTAIFSGINMLPRGKFATSEGLEKIWMNTYEHKLGDQSLYFHTPNWLTDYRARTLLTKEPETIFWLDRIPLNSVVYDIGANIGVYSIYAAAVKNAQVLAFEPSFLNLELLFRNIQTNNLQSKITIAPLSLSNSNQVENFYMQGGDNIWGGAHNSSGQSVTQSGKSMEDFSVSSQIAITLDSLVETLNLPLPDYVKIDVDGIESMILQGAQKTLSKAKEILIEVDLGNTLQSAEIHNILSRLDFVRIESIDRITLMENQIWVKKEINN